MFSAVQNTSFPLSDLINLICSVDIVLTNSVEPIVVCVELRVKSLVEIVHVMLADGIQSPVTHFRVISPPAITAVGVGVNITDGTGTI